MPIARLSILALAALLFSACDNEVDLLTPPEEGGALPVVFGLVNSSENTQYISLTRTFRFSEGGSAFTSAADPDSLYFPAEAAQVEIRNHRNGQTTTLERVDLAGEDQVRQTGLFPVSPNILHRFRLSDVQAVAGDSLTLTVNRPEQLTAQASIRLLSELEFNQQRLPPAMYSFIGRTPLTFSWRNLENGAPFARYELGFEVTFEEISPSGSVVKTLYFAPGQNLDPNRTSATLVIEGFLPFLASRLTADQSITRRFREIRLVLTGGDANFGAYEELIRANAGITATQELPPFSNVDNGLGLLGSITKLRQQDAATLSNGTFDSLRMSLTTRALNFQ